MKDICKRTLRNYLAEHLARTRSHLGMTQEEFAETLMMEPRSYAALERNENFFGALTFILYLAFLCDDPASLVQELRKIILDVRKREEL